MKFNHWIACVVSVAGLSLAATAQDAKLQPVTPGGAPTLAPVKATINGVTAPQKIDTTFSGSPTWSDPEIEAVGKAFEGAWRTVKPVGQGDDKAKTADVFLAVAHVHINSLPDTLYVEAARVDAPWAPFRQSIWQIYRKQGEIHIRTIEFRLPKAAHPFLVSLWAAPDKFPAALDLSETYATLDIAVKMEGKTLTGKTKYPYPTTRQGAVEMTSEMTLTGDTLSTSDRGFDATGKIVWGSAEGTGYQFKRFTPDVSVQRFDSGLTRINYGGGEGEPLATDWRVGLHTVGSILSGFTFEDSRVRNNLVAFRIGQSTSFAGLDEGTKELRKGERLKLLIPSGMAFGANGNARYKIPADAWLSYDIEVVNAEPPAEPKATPELGPVGPVPPGAAPTAPTTPPAKVEPGHEGHDHSKPH